MSADRPAARWLPILAIVGISLLTSIVVTWPDRYRPVEVWRFWDGPSYLTIAKEGYVPAPGNPLAPDPNRPPIYIMHLPAYPATIRAVAIFGWTNAVLLSAWLAAAGAAVLFYILCRDVWGIAGPFWVTMAFLFLPPRWILYRSVGASEPLALFLALLAILLIEKGRWAGAIAASCALALTRWTGVVVAGAWALLLIRQGHWRRILWLAPIPLSLVAFFIYSKQQFGDWQAPFEVHLAILARIRILGDAVTISSWQDNIRGELVLLLALACAAGIWMIRRLAVPAVYAASQLLFLLIVYGWDWPRFILGFAPMLAALSLHDYWRSSAGKWLLVSAAGFGILWARASIPYNLMKDPELLLRHLGISS